MGMTRQRTSHRDRDLSHDGAALAAVETALDLGRLHRRRIKRLTAAKSDCFEDLDERVDERDRQAVEKSLTPVDTAQHLILEAAVGFDLELNDDVAQFAYMTIGSK